MRNECEIVRDLLPLYKEGLTSDSSNELVEEHLKTCPECARLLAKMDEAEGEDKPEQADEIPMKAFSRTYRKKKRRLALLISAMAAAVLLALYSWLSAPRYLTYSQAVERTEELETGLLVTFTDQVHHTKVMTYESPEGTAYTDLECWTSTLDQLWKAQPASSAVLEGDVIFFRDNKYKTTGPGDVQMYGPDMGPSFSLRRLALNFYFWVAACTFLVSGLAGFLLRKKKAGQVLLSISCVPLAWCLSSIIVERGIRASTWSLTRDFSLICLLCIALSIALITGRQILRERKAVQV